MSGPSLFAPLEFASGAVMKNRFMLAPLTNCQSHADGTLGRAEHQWLTMRASGGFGMTMTCAAHVERRGQAFPGQLGVWHDLHLPGLARLAHDIKARGSLALVQLHHGGTRALPELTGQAPLAPSVDPQSGARAMTTAEVQRLVEDFAQAAVRAQRAGFDGIELHAAHSYLLNRFISPEFNTRTDTYGGALEGRSRVVYETLAEIRARCDAAFLVGIRVSLERYGTSFAEMLEYSQRLVDSGLIDFIDFSLWDCFKAPESADHAHKPLIQWLREIDRKDVRIGVAGKIMSGDTAQRCLDVGADFVAIGRAAIIHHDFPKRVARNPAFTPQPLPVNPEWLAHEGLAPTFIRFMRKWDGFVTCAQEPAHQARPSTTLPP
jgi:2,4-dienoyl-CoA reductase-like NADH-dependent reductase (Old Yellow Enzyme family)